MWVETLNPKIKGNVDVNRRENCMKLINIWGIKNKKDIHVEELYLRCAQANGYYDKPVVSKTLKIRFSLKENLN